MNLSAMRKKKMNVNDMIANAVSVRSAKSVNGNGSTKTTSEQTQP